MSKKIDQNRRRALHMTSGLVGAVTGAGFAVPFVSEEKRKEFLDDVKKTAINV